MSSPESGTSTPTQKALDQRYKSKVLDVIAGLHRVADELADALHTAAVRLWVRVLLAGHIESDWQDKQETWEPNLVEGIVVQIEWLIEDIKQYPSAHPKEGEESRSSR